MILRFAIAAAIIVIAVTATIVLERRRTRRASVSGVDVPTHVDRADFPATAAPWLVVMFSKGDCESCAIMRDRITALGSDDIAVYEVDFAGARAVHERYGIAAVPTTVVVDASGEVRESWIGRATQAELTDALEALLHPTA
jgi:hypothetical protein